MTTVLAVTNQKGGVGKTTTAVNVAYFLAKAGKTTLLVDLDPQGNATSGLGVDKQSLKSTMTDVMLRRATLADVVQPTGHKQLSLAPCTPQLANAEVELANADRKFVVLRDNIQALNGDYDVVIIDCPPSLSLLTVNALIASHSIVLPVQAEFYALEGLGQLLETMKLVSKNMNPDLRLLGVLATMMDTRTTLSQQVLAEIHKHFGEKVFKTTIPRNIRLAEAPSHGVPIGVYDRFSKGSRAYKATTKEIMERAGL